MKKAFAPIACVLTLLLLSACGEVASTGGNETNPWATCDYETSTCTGDSPWLADTPSFNDVNYCVNTCASPGDTVVVPAGTATWNSGVLVTSCVTIQGAGIGQTKINGYGGPLFRIQMDADSISSGCGIRLTGFTMNGHYITNSAGVSLGQNHTVGAIPKNIRIDHNEFILMQDAGVVFNAGSTQGWGVVDSNIFTDCKKSMDAFGRYTYSWEREPDAQASLGTSNNIFFEDNVLNYTPDLRESQATISSGHGGRWVARFNTINVNNTVYYIQGQDIHGNNGIDLDAVEATCPGGSFDYCATGTANCCDADNRSVMVAESYNNTFNLSGADQPIRGVDIRGGTVMVFNERYVHPSGTYTGNIQIREEDQSDGLCSSPAPDYNSCFDPVIDTYIFNNRNTFDDSEADVFELAGEDAYVTPDMNYWIYKATFDGTSGVGVGDLADMPATCTTGVAFWAQDQGDWNQTGSDGVLYRCSGTDQWELYYEPYTYPHPLRGL